MPLTIVKDKATKETKVVFVPDKKPVAIGINVPPRPRMDHEIDYDMHKLQAALVPACQPRQRSGT